jgi:hypothetical protein
MTIQDDDQGNDIPQLREAAKRGEAATKRADEAERRLALVEAGVDTKSPVGKLFTEAYKGPLTEDAIKEAWGELVPANAVAPAPLEEAPAAPAPTTQQLEETDARRTLTAGGAGDHVNEQPDPDPVAAGYEEFHERMKGGARREQAAGSVFGSLMQSAMKGDERAIWTGWTQDELDQAK